MKFLKVCDDEQESEDSEDNNGGLLNQINYRPKDIIDTPLIYEIKKSHDHYHFKEPRAASKES